jgi:hypothetical protein
VSAEQSEATPVVPPEKTPKEPSKRPPQPKDAARKPQRQTVVLPPKKPPIPSSSEAVVLPPKKTADPRFYPGGEAGRHRGAIRTVSAYAKVAA